MHPKTTAPLQPTNTDSPPHSTQHGLLTEATEDPFKLEITILPLRQSDLPQDSTRCDAPCSGVPVPHASCASGSSNGVSVTTAAIPRPPGVIVSCVTPPRIGPSSVTDKTS